MGRRQIGWRVTCQHTPLISLDSICQENLSIIHLGRWSSLDMVSRYCRSITFADCLEHYREEVVFSSSIKREY